MAKFGGVAQLSYKGVAPMSAVIAVLMPACDVEVEPDAFKKYCSDTGSKPTRHTLHEFISKQT